MMAPRQTMDMTMAKVAPQNPKIVFEKIIQPISVRKTRGRPPSRPTVKVDQEVDPKETATENVHV